MTRSWKHLTASAVGAIHAEVIAADGGATGLRDEGLLESAVAAPQATLSGKPLMEDGIEIAAAYLFYICRNHPFVDGNERTALAACLVFLEVNGLLPRRKLAAAAWESLVLDVAASRSDREETTKRLKKLVRRRRR